MEIRESWLMVEHVEDWSKVRSHGRARRRMRQGHPQNIVHRQVPRKDAITTDGGRTYTMHPEAARECRRILNEFHEGWKTPVLVRRESMFAMTGAA